MAYEVTAETVLGKYATLERELPSHYPLFHIHVLQFYRYPIKRKDQGNSISLHPHLV